MDQDRISSDVAFTPAVKAVQQRKGSRGGYRRIEERGGFKTTVTPELAAFIAGRDSFFLATASADGQPYIQHRGGAAGFLRVLDERTLGFADFRGNRQYITTGNVRANDRVSLFLMDYAHRRRLKIFGHTRIIDAVDDAALAARLAVPRYPGRVERLVLVTVKAFDWNCPQHITPRFTQAELEAVLVPARDAMAALQRENERLRRELDSRDDGKPR